MLFRAPLDADSLLVGFDLTADQIKARAASGGAKWWFLIAEHPTAPRFGLDISTAGNAGPAAKSDDLDWLDLPMASNHLLAAPPSLTAGAGAKDWATNSANMAAMLLQKPVRAVRCQRTSRRRHQSEAAHSSDPRRPGRWHLQSARSANWQGTALMPPIDPSALAQQIGARVAAHDKAVADLATVQKQSADLARQRAAALAGGRGGEVARFDRQIAAIDASPYDA